MTPLQTLEREADTEELEGAELADTAYEAELQKAETLDQLRTSVALDMREMVEGDEEAEERVEELEDGVTKVATDHGHMKVDHSLSGTRTGGWNQEMSHETAISPDPLSAEAITQDPKTASTIVRHEDSEKEGHAGQIKDAHDFIDASGQEKEALLSIEGNVEHEVAQVEGARDDQPTEVYGEGEEWVKDAGADDMNSYMRKNGEHAGDHVWMQANILKDSDLTTPDMKEKLHGIGFADEEVKDIVKMVRKEAKDVQYATAA